MTKVTIENKVPDCDERIVTIAVQIGKFIDLVNKTSNPNLALAILNERLSKDIDLELDFRISGILE